MMEILHPLTQAERDDFQQLFEQRLAKVKAKTDDVFTFKEVAAPPYIVNSSMYWIFGLDTDTLPADYCQDPAAMTNFQEQTYYDQIKSIDDDFVPYLVPWLGTIVAASAFGCKIEYPYKADPTANPRYYPVVTHEDIENLQVIDPEKDGLMPTVLDFLRYMKANSFLPVGITDFQGPLTTANQLMGYDKLIYLMFDRPDLMHRLMHIVTESLILWVKMQKEVIGEPMNECIADQQVYLGKNAGIWFSDDDAVLMSPETYREFVVPYNSRILTEFGGGVVHYCGNATHHADSFLAMEGLKALNIFNLYNIPSVVELQQQLGDKVALFVCDFTPVDYEAYFDEMLSTLSYRGLVICSQFSPTVGLLKGGRYDATQREMRSTRKAIYEYLRTRLEHQAGRPVDQ
ncbi:MAG: hypothetical protein GY759_00265 [Chloroflexi bacterium]|nr:hypothetical protein [Chloroflexota bacterium]